MRAADETRLHALIRNFQSQLNAVFYEIACKRAPIQTLNTRQPRFPYKLGPDEVKNNFCNGNLYEKTLLDAGEKIFKILLDAILYKMQNSKTFLKRLGVHFYASTAF